MERLGNFMELNSFPNDKILDLTKLKAFTDDKLNVSRMMISILDRVENTVEKGENAGYQCFPESSSLGGGVYISRNYVVKS